MSEAGLLRMISRIAMIVILLVFLLLMLNLYKQTSHFKAPEDSTSSKAGHP